MSDYAVIVQNDESKWDDIKGELYNYPSTYKAILTPGCRVIYYKGNMKNAAFAPYRLSPRAHYFGIGVVGDSIIDPDSSRNERYCEILEYQEFEEAVPIKEGDDYLEPILESKRSNYWRYGVREITKATYERILSTAKIKGYQVALPNPHQELESFQPLEGEKKERFSSYYERNPFCRSKAIEIHGLTCMACGFNFEGKYGALGRGFIHVRHNKPISESGRTRINPQTDMSVLCPNCHAMIHRKKDRTLSVEELQEMVHNNAL
jgi:predicted HNH restriction endonuclease